MIKISNEKGKEVYIDTEDIKEIKKHIDIKKPSVRCKIYLNNDKWLYSCQSLRELTELLKPIG